MSLSEHDKARFAEVVHDLEVEDPDLMRKLRRRVRRRAGGAAVFALACVAVVLAGLGVAVLGASTGWTALEIIGLIVVLAGPLILSYWWSIRTAGWRTVLSWTYPGSHSARRRHGQPPR